MTADDVLQGEYKMVELLDINRQTSVRREWEKLLSLAGLQSDPPYSAVYGIYVNGRLAATGARDHNRLKCVAVDPGHQGGPLFRQLLTGLVADAFDQGIEKLYLYTKPQAVDSFRRVGFLPLAATAEGITFMERGRPSFNEYLTRLSRHKGAPAESVVVEGDLLGEQEISLIRDALTRKETVRLFVMEGRTPLDLIRERLREFPGVFCHSAEGYLIPLSDFPAYFLPEREDRIKVQANIEGGLLADRIAHALDITGLTAVHDPHDPVRVAYNETLGDCLDGKLELTLVSPADL